MSQHAFLAEYSLPGVMRYLQTEWQRNERDRIQWALERAEMKTRIAKLEGENSALRLEIENYAKKIKIFETSLGNQPTNSAKAELDAVKRDFDLHHTLHADIDLTPLIESRQYLDKCIQEVEYMLQSTSLDQQFETGAASSSEEYNGRELPERVPRELPNRELPNRESRDLPAGALSKDVHPSKFNEPTSPFGRAKWNSRSASGSSPRSPRSAKSTSSSSSSSSSSLLGSPRGSARSSITTTSPSKDVNINIENIAESKSSQEISATTKEYGEWKLQCAIDNSRERSSLRAIAFIQDSHPVVSSDDGSLQLWDISRDTPTASPLIGGHEGIISSLKYCKSTNRLYSAGQDRSIKGWSPGRTALQPLVSVTSHGDFIWDLALHEESTRLASASSDGTVKVWDIKPKRQEELTTIRSSPDSSRPNKSATSVAFFEQGRQLIIGYEDNEIQLVDIETGTKILLFESASGSLEQSRANIVNAVSYSHLDNLVLSAHADGAIKHFDPATGHCLYTAPNAHANSVTCLSNSPAGKEFVSGGEEGCVKIWSIDTRSVVQELQTHQALEGVLAVNWRTPRLLATVGDDGMANFYTR